MSAAEDAAVVVLAQQLADETMPGAVVTGVMLGITMERVGGSGSVIRSVHITFPTTGMATAGEVARAVESALRDDGLLE